MKTKNSNSFLMVCAVISIISLTISTTCFRNTVSRHHLSAVTEDVKEAKALTEYQSAKAVWSSYTIVADKSFTIDENSSVKEQWEEIAKECNARIIKTEIKAFSNAFAISCEDKNDLSQNVSAEQIKDFENYVSVWDVSENKLSIVALSKDVSGTVKYDNCFTDGTKVKPVTDFTSFCKILEAEGKLDKAFPIVLSKGKAISAKEYLSSAVFATGEAFTTRLSSGIQ